jgi:hypothetical protein|mmetsp:Transcript_47090/g.77383  ORF Transcript_47090/g.77383 Transcript_47090/m.77383 type:complete len:93 (+) Transcript_47090:733-1011(+)
MLGVGLDDQTPPPPPGPLAYMVNIVHSYRHSASEEAKTGFDFLSANGYMSAKHGPMGGGQGRNVLQWGKDGASGAWGGSSMWGQAVPPSHGG